MTLPQPALSLPDETAASIVSVDRCHLEPRCRVCRNDSVRGKVNDLLATGARHAMILRALQDYNAKLDGRDRVTIDSVRNHTARHFPVQQVAKATYREILERRAKENGIDFVEGKGTAITPLAMLDVVMIKGLQDPGRRRHGGRLQGRGRRRAQAARADPQGRRGGRGRPRSSPGRTASSPRCAMRCPSATTTRSWPASTARSCPRRHGTSRRNRTTTTICRKWTKRNDHPSAFEAAARFFQANPKLYDVDGALARLDHIWWRVPQYASRLCVGDVVLIWRSGADAGVVADIGSACGSVSMVPVKLSAPP
jgi:hypothetical protein